MAGGFGTWVLAAMVVTLGISILQGWDERIAWGVAIMILLAVFLRYPAAMSQISKIFGLGQTAPNGGRNP